MPILYCYFSSVITWFSVIVIIALKCDVVYVIFWALKVSLLLCTFASLTVESFFGIPYTSRCFSSVFTAQCYAYAVLAMGLCLCLSVTSRSPTKTAKGRITQTTPHDTPGTLVFWCQRSPRNSTGVTPVALRGRQMQVGCVKIGDFQQIASYISKTVKDRHIVSIKVE